MVMIVIMMNKRNKLWIQTISPLRTKRHDGNKQNRWHNHLSIHKDDSKGGVIHNKE